ncbi:Cadmium, cobalt and zinc/H(+)-K(+) antiporter [Rosistilla carotiformis]|uniref:Cadmium, cobalt and zinc/H(+)-K(+) antiporter n=1 Tax=Rosistilla carotiformis TaxID=2528017 RepID=A0A518JWC2_9BACT|nr:CDF family Co(II)/Ni(II) efflux transporter DmeF [Rosistilla carotiformis]QDV69842.1 Cadmium, cobalt and zinc/H(+)-K(+) antiporter [Rosistilla carotiformis]
MSNQELADWHDDHSFGQDQKKPGESRTIVVIAITLAMMVIEIIAGQVYDSMALLADGLHMASHAAALTISVFAYMYARRYAHDTWYSFGTGKVNALGGFAGALLLGVFSLLMVWESVHRLIDPVEISFNEAILVAVVGLVVNAICALVLGHQHDHGHGSGCSHNHDHNLQAAYMHVLADALTSVLAIAALLAGKFFGWAFLDPIIGIVGAVVVARWSISLIRTTSDVLLDRQATDPVLDRIRHAIEDDDHDVVDLHVWSIGPGLYATEIIIVSSNPVSPGEFKKMLPDDLSIAHAAVEVHHRDATTQQGT